MENVSSFEEFWRILVSSKKSYPTSNDYYCEIKFKHGLRLVSKYLRGLLRWPKNDYQMGSVTGPNNLKHGTLDT